MELYFLGTGAGLPSKQRNVTSIALRLPETKGNVWLFDCGEGTQHQMLSSPIRPSKVDKIFITHLHGDHLYGLPGFLGSRAFSHTELPLVIYGPPGIRRFIETALETSQTHLPYALDIVEITPGTILESKLFTVTCLPLAHRIASYGYRIEEHTVKGTLHVNKLRALDVPEGPIYRALKSGENVTLSDGRTLRSNDFVGEPIPGRIVTILGDTMPSENAVLLAKDADVLVHEATYGVSESERARRHHHSTTVDAAEIAKSAGVRALVLTHISARYDFTAISNLHAEAAHIFPNVQIARDHWQFNIPRRNDDVNA